MESTEKNNNHQKVFLSYRLGLDANADIATESTEKHGKK
jgi:hypothetical protein